MYVDWNVLITASKVIGAITVIVGFIVTIYKLLKKIDKLVENNQANLRSQGLGAQPPPRHLNFW